MVGLAGAPAALAFVGAPVAPACARPAAAKPVTSLLFAAADPEAISPVLPWLQPALTKPAQQTNTDQGNEERVIT